MFYLAGIAIDFFLMVILTAKRNKSRADTLLALWLFFIGLHLTFFYLFVTGRYIHYPFILGHEFGLPLLHGPFLYLYTSSLTGQTDRSVPALAHFFPVLLFYIPLLPFISLPGDEKVMVYVNQGKGYEWLIFSRNIAIALSGIIYIALSLFKLRRHRKIIADEFSNTDKVDLAWLRYLIIGMSCIWLVVIVGSDEATFATVVLYVFFMGYFGIKQTTIFSHRPVDMDLLSENASGTSTGKLQEGPAANDVIKQDNGIQNQNAGDKSGHLAGNQDQMPAVEAGKSKYVKSGLQEQDLQVIHSQLVRLMESEKLYTNPELTLSDTAQKLQVHPNYLSQVINSVIGKNFYDYINNQRVEEFNRLIRLPENKKFTLLSLAFECGFNSKTSFNRNFRKLTGLSPTEYVKHLDIRMVSEN